MYNTAVTWLQNNGFTLYLKKGGDESLKDISLQPPIENAEIFLGCDLNEEIDENIKLGIISDADLFFQKKEYKAGLSEATPNRNFYSYYWRVMGFRNKYSMM